MTSTRKDNMGNDNIKSKYDEEYNLAVLEIKRYGSGNVTYNPRNRSYINITKIEEKTRLFDEFARNDMPVYILGVTNNKGDFNKCTRNVYVQLREEGGNAMLGQWTDGENIYRDVVVVLSGITRDRALNYKKQYEQLIIVEIQKNGNSEYI